MNERTKFLLEDVNIYYGETQAIKSVTLPLYENLVTAFIGPSGCGKSTLLRALNRMNDLIAGSRLTGKVLLDDHSIYDRRVDLVELRRRVGMVFQRSNPFPKSIFENAAYGLRVAGIRDRSLIAQRVEESLQSAALWDEVKDRLHSSAMGLSGGQQQRLCIARALAIQPEVILMDEPASALDPIATARIEELIHQLRGSYSIVIVTHNMQQAARISDRTAFFYMGELVEYGKTNKLFTMPENQRTEDYVTGRFG